MLFVRGFCVCAASILFSFCAASAFVRGFLAAAALDLL
jgi:hypothetical protein